MFYRTRWVAWSSAFGLWLGAGMAFSPSARADGCADTIRRFLPTGAAYDPIDPAWITTQLAKPPVRGDGMSDLTNALPASYSRLTAVIWENSSDADRRAAIAALPLSDLIVAPGHRILRNPDQIKALKDIIVRDKGGHFGHDPVLLNVIGDAQGKIQGVDIWNAHHRLVAYHEAGYQKVGDIPAGNLRVLVNGHPEHGSKWGHMLPAAGVDLPDLRGQYRVAGYGEGADPGTIVVDGGRSNFDLGSRLTLGRLAQISRTRQPPRVGVFFGTYDPVHEGHVATARAAAKEFNLDEVILVANATPAHKPNATSLNHRTKLLALRVGSDDKLNAYIGDSGAWVNDFGKDVFFRHLEQVYGTRELFEIYGGDSYEKLLNLGQIQARDVKYIVFKRELPSVRVPDALKPYVLVSDTQLPPRSSTEVRNAIRSGQPVSPDVMTPALMDYIRANRLYGARP